MINVLIGSASGIGREIYKIYKSNGLDVLGIDKKESKYTDLVCDLSNDQNVGDLIEKLKTLKIQTLVFCAGIQLSNNDVDKIFKVNVLSFLKILNDINDNLNNSVICGISSIHAVSSNDENISYASSKSALETTVRGFATNKSSNSFYIIRLGATNTELLHANVKDINKLETQIPSGKIFDKHQVAKLVFMLNKEFKDLLNGSIIQLDNGVLSMLKTE